MGLILKKIKAWFPILTLGNTRSRKNELSEYSRYLVLKSLQEEGFFNYLLQSRTLDDLVKKFNWEYPSKYVNDFITILVSDKVIAENNSKYKLIIGQELIKPEVKHIEDFNEVFAEYAVAIPARLKGEYYDYTGRLSLFNWDSVLAGQIYQALRDSAFNFINKRKIRNMKLLDLGCGPGYETADIWVKLDGNNVEITALDYDSNLLTIAREEFCINLKYKGYEEVTWNQLDNPPTFVYGSASDMSMFKNNTFDVVYFSNFLHWLENPLDGVKEIFRILKPGGFIFGGQGTSEVTNPYLDIAARVVKGTYGYFSRKQFVDWLETAGFIKIRTATMVNTFKAKKPVID